MVHTKHVKSHGKNQYLYHNFDIFGLQRYNIFFIPQTFAFPKNTKYAAKHIIRPFHSRIVALYDTFGC